ncbi:MAG TPA: PrgI family protein [Candidatus Saccharimonadia bacterium]|nr:PrgI family protein [Candidatus Saccharimonadia bacterium]
MGQYKVPQDVEAEDKILGPLTFKEFIYALMGFGWAVLCFAIFRTIPALMVIVGLPPALLLLLLAFYNRDGQSFEQLLIAGVQYFAASRRRVWTKDDLIETFHINPTIHAAEATQRNSVEVRSELEKLANLIDSRGWNHPPEEASAQALPITAHTDRMVPPPPPTPHAPEDIPEDILDLQQSPLAQNLAELLRTAAEDVREEAMQQMTGKAVKPAAANAPAPISTSGVTAAPASDILQLATQSDELSVSQIAAQATRRVQLPDGQTVEIPINGS